MKHRVKIVFLQMFGILLNHSSRFLGRKCPKSQPGFEREAESPADFQLERKLKGKKYGSTFVLSMPIIS